MNDGGPAFPRPASEFTKNGTLPDGNDAVESQEGMTLRDYFAAAAIQGWAANGQLKLRPDVGGNPFQATANWAYEAADAMLAARQREE